VLLYHSHAAYWAGAESNDNIVRIYLTSYKNCVNSHERMNLSSLDLSIGYEGDNYVNIKQIDFKSSVGL
jgi:hypothetical protein